MQSYDLNLNFEIKSKTVSQVILRFIFMIKWVLYKSIIEISNDKDISINMLKTF